MAASFVLWKPNLTPKFRGFARSTFNLLYQRLYICGFTYKLQPTGFASTDFLTAYRARAFADLLHGPPSCYRMDLLHPLLSAIAWICFQNRDSRLLSARSLSILPTLAQCSQLEPTWLIFWSLNYGLIMLWILIPVGILMFFIKIGNIECVMMCCYELLYRLWFYTLNGLEMSLVNSLFLKFIVFWVFSFSRVCPESFPSLQKTGQPSLCRVRVMQHWFKHTYYRKYVDDITRKLDSQVFF